MCNYDMYVLVKWSYKPYYFLYVHLMVEKDLLRSVGKQKLFDCVLIIYVMGLILFTLLIVL